MKLDDIQTKWIRNNAEMLDSIFRPDLDEMKREVFEMEDSKSRNLKIEFIKKYQKILNQVGLIKDSKERKPETGI